jgi:hypothetical protein
VQTTAKEAQSMLIHIQHLRPHMLAFVLMPKVYIILSFQQPHPREETHVLDNTISS